MTDNRKLYQLFGFVLCLALSAAAQVKADDSDVSIKNFYGAYVGEAFVEGTQQFRDIIVSVEPIRNGFSIYTSTVIRDGPQRAVRGVKWRAETQSFTKTDVPHVYEPLVRKSMFARKQEPNLLAGDTLAWASVRGQTLGVYAINVLQDGHYELRVFERTLTDVGMDISFIRYSDGRTVRELKGRLARTKEDNPEN
jgi:hypothetical protein